MKNNNNNQRNRVKEEDENIPRAPQDFKGFRQHQRCADIISDIMLFLRSMS